MEKTIGREYGNVADRETFLKDNCDKIEEKGYMRPYTPEELQGKKESLIDNTIRISDLQEEKKEKDDYYKDLIKPLAESNAETIANIKARAEYVKEICYKFVDQESKETGYYNKDGMLIESRPATADELQPSLFHVVRKTGTDNIN